MHFQNHEQNHTLSNSKVVNIKLTTNASNGQSFISNFQEKNLYSHVQIKYRYSKLFVYLHKITTCSQILLCSSAKIYYKNNCHNSAKTICTLYSIRAQQQWIEKQVFAISSHIYQTVSQDYMLLHRIAVPQSFAKTQLSKHRKNFSKS